MEVPAMKKVMMEATVQFADVLCTKVVRRKNHYLEERFEGVFIGGL